MSSVAAGSRLGRFLVKRRLGRGGEGEVFLAGDLRDNVNVAIKVIRADVSQDAAARARREATVIASLSHPNIVKVLALGYQSSLWYIAMEYVDGGSMGDRVGEAGAVPPSSALKMIGEVAAALHAAHTIGVLHRDVSPKNMLFDSTSGSIRLVDFGLCQIMAEAKSGRVVGTPQYIAPEVWAGEPATPKSDVYALGLSLYFLLAGRPAVSARRIDECRQLHVRGEWELPEQWDPAIIKLIRDATARRQNKRLTVRDFMRRTSSLVARAGETVTEATRTTIPPLPRGQAAEFVRTAVKSGGARVVIHGTNATARHLLVRDVTRKTASRARWCRDQHQLSDLVRRVVADEAKSLSAQDVLVVELRTGVDRAPAISLIEQLCRTIGAANLVVSSDLMVAVSGASFDELRLAAMSSSEAARILEAMVGERLSLPVLLTSDALLLLTEVINHPGRPLEDVLLSAETRRLKQNKLWIGSEQVVRPQDSTMLATWPDTATLRRIERLRTTIGSLPPLIVQAGDRSSSASKT